MTHKDFANVPVMWEPEETSGKRAKEFMKLIEKKYNVQLRDYWDFHKWSIENVAEFWDEFWKLLGIKHSEPYKKVIDLTVPMYEAPEWFEGVKMNFAENLLRFRDDNVALIVAGEDRETEKVTYAEMFKEATLYAAALRKLGIKKGDRVSCFMSNRKEPVFAMLAATSIGAIWLGALPLMGPQAVLNRFKQVQPKILFTVDRFSQDREEKEMLSKVKEIADGLPSLEKVIIVPSKPESKLKNISVIRNSCFLDEFLESGKNPDGSVPRMVFEQVSLAHPVFISYTSGTTGLPKALVHGSGGLLSISRDFWLHSESDRSRCWLSMSPVGWASWNMFCTMLFFGPKVVLFEGSPYFLSPTFLWDMVDEFGISNLFLTPSVLDDLEKKGYLPSEPPADIHREIVSIDGNIMNRQNVTKWCRAFSGCRTNVHEEPITAERNHLNSLEVIMSGGSVVKPQNYDFVYKKIKTDIIFSSAYGSTELMGACMILDHTLRIHRGEITAPALAIDISCVDDAGKPVLGEIGELVINKPTPSLPLGLWGDDDKSIFKKTYFDKFPGKFAVGDLAIINPVTKGIIICGRSDDTLKPRGCRFGSSEIYNIVDTFPEVRDSICVSQYDKDRNERAVLFLKMRNGHLFNENLVRRIRAAIARELSVRHVPEVILETPDIPHNMNGKKMEIVVKKIINKMAYNPETVINPECLKNFEDIPELRGF